METTQKLKLSLEKIMKFIRKIKNYYLNTRQTLQALKNVHISTVTYLFHRCCPNTSFLIKENNYLTTELLSSLGVVTSLPIAIMHI